MIFIKIGNTRVEEKKKKNEKKNELEIIIYYIIQIKVFKC